MAKNFLFQGMERTLLFISLFLVNTFQFWTIPPVFSRWEPGFACSFKMQYLMKLEESTDKICLKNAVLGNTLEKKLWGLFRIKSAASSSLRMETEILILEPSHSQVCDHTRLGFLMGWNGKIWVTPDFLCVSFPLLCLSLTPASPLSPSPWVQVHFWSCAQHFVFSFV